MWRKILIFLCVSAFGLGETCGQRKAVKPSLIPEELNPGEWPWHALVWLKKSYCSGTLISKNLVVTSAHCLIIGNITFANINQVKVILGKHGSDINTTLKQSLEVAEIILHDNYTRPFKPNHDIALIKLKSDVKFDDFIQPACLLNPAIIEDDKVIEQKGTVVSWKGPIEYDTVPNIRLDASSFTKMANTICIEELKKHSKKDDNGGIICASEQDCDKEEYLDGGNLYVFVPNEESSDSGKSSIDKSSGSWYIRGLTSIVTGDPRKLKCDKRQYSLLTDVAYHYDWIMNYEEF